MPIRARNNAYQGVNAHLNSFLQNHQGEWESFHSAHIVDLARLIDAQLPPGYFARLEKSLQIREGEAERPLRRPRPDVTVYQSQSIVQPGAGKSGVVPTLTAPVVETMDIEDEEYLSAIVIYEVSEEGVLGKPVTRIELLSSTNKPPGEGYLQYRDKRNAGLRGGMPLVEIDYLHQQRSVAVNIPIYPDGDSSHPYHILVSDPRPSLKDGLSKIYSFDVGMPIPSVEIPLAHDETLLFDFGAPYNVTFDNTRFYSALLDYEQLPERIETYSASDRERIEQLMRNAATLGNTH